VGDLTLSVPGDATVVGDCAIGLVITGDDTWVAAIIFTMNMEEAKSYLAKFEGSQEKLKPGPTKRKLSKDFQNEDDEYTPKRKKTFSWSENYNEEEDDPDQNTGARTKKSPVSSCLKTKGRPRKILNSDGKTFGKPEKVDDIFLLRVTLIRKTFRVFYGMLQFHMFLHRLFHYGRMITISTLERFAGQ
jgi:hypothetical protein